MGYTLEYANQMNLTAIVPRNDLASTKYCLANLGFEYLIYLPDGGSVWVDLTDASGQLTVEWLNPSTGEKMSGGEITGGSRQEFAASFSGDAVLYIVSKRTLPPTPPPPSPPKPWWRARRSPVR